MRLDRDILLTVFSGAVINEFKLRQSNSPSEVRGKEYKLIIMQVKYQYVWSGRDILFTVFTRAAISEVRQRHMWLTK